VWLFSMSTIRLLITFAFVFAAAPVRPYETPEADGRPLQFPPRTHRGPDTEGGGSAVGTEASGHGLSQVSDSAIIREGPHRSEVGHGRRG
jgi:hypothetical protein